MDTDHYGSRAEAVAVTPHDTTLLSPPARGIYIGVGGHVTILTMNGATVLFKNVPSGTILPVMAKRVNSTGTTATDIVAFY